MVKATKQPTPTVEAAAKVKAAALKKLAAFDRKMAMIDQGLAQFPTAATAPEETIARARNAVIRGKEMVVQQLPGESDGETLSRVRLHPSANTAIAITDFRPISELKARDLVVETNKQIAAIQSGDMSRPEAMLFCQAQTLDAIFNEMVCHAGVQLKTGGRRDVAEQYLRMALKAQSQCRATIETLAEVKNPRTATFVKQQNNAQQQQVVNGDVTNTAHAPAHGQEKTIVSNEQLEG